MNFLNLGELSTGAMVVYIVLLVVVSYFGLANSTIQLINYFRFYKPFTDKLVKFSVFSESGYVRIVRSRLGANILVFVLSLGLTVYMSLRVGGAGVISAVVSFAAGIFLYRKNLLYELWNVRHYVRQYREYLDKEKFSRFLRAEYDISPEKLSDDQFILRRMQKGK